MTAENPRIAVARQAMRAAISTIEHGYRDAVAAFTLIDTIEDRQAAFELANELAKQLGELNTQAVELRKRCVHRIWEVEELSLARLASRVGLSKSRAEQLVNAFKAADQDPPEAPHE